MVQGEVDVLDGRELDRVVGDHTLLKHHEVAVVVAEHVTHAGVGALTDQRGQQVRVSLPPATAS